MGGSRRPRFLSLLAGPSTLRTIPDFGHLGLVPGHTLLNQSDLGHQDLVLGRMFDGVAGLGRMGQVAINGLSGLPTRALKTVMTSETMVETVDALVAKIEDRIIDRLIPVVMAKLEREPESIDALVAKVEDRIIDRLIPVVLAKLQEEPDPVRELIQGQSTGLMVDLVTTFRDQAAEADRLAERAVRRLLPRGHHAEGDGKIGASLSGADRDLTDSAE